ncbi:hypothetical protein [Streptomyces sp. NRRL B-24484]|uniref:hypothetical protein n=1 Tax=Streptomyces sp. NRRL B-24484 TaxID=1463833 RepID=UPI0006939F08|nr:hypothetical protein [Streptomyces sp. NRRL B-24484]
MIPAGRTPVDTARVCSLLGIKPSTFTNTRRWEAMRAKPISRPGTKVRIWDEEQVLADIEGREIPLLAPADPDAVYTFPVEDGALQGAAVSFLDAYLTGDAKAAGPVAAGAQIAAASRTFTKVELLGLYAADEVPAPAEGAVVDVNAKLVATDDSGAWPVAVQLRFAFDGGRWAVAELTQEDDEDLLDGEEARLVIPEDRRPTESSWRTYLSPKSDPKKTSGPAADEVVFGVRHYKRKTIRVWDSEVRFLQGEKKAGGRPAGSTDKGPRRKDAERNLLAEQRRDKVRELLADNPALTAAEVGEALGVSREWGRRLLSEVRGAGA